MSSQTRLNVQGLSKAYRRKVVLKEVSLVAEASEAIAILGSNGAGKSTFMGCLTGQRVPDVGTIELCGHDIFDAPRAVAECMGFVPEHPFLYGELTVGEMLRFVAEAKGMERGTADSETARLLEMFTLTGAEEVLCRELSQGMGRKVAIIAGILHRPQLLVLDEVFNGLDRPSVEKLLTELEQRREDGSAVLVASHDLHLLADWCERGLLLSKEGHQDLQGDSWREWAANPTLQTA